MTQQEIEKIKEEMDRMTPGERIKQSIQRQDLIEKAKKLKKLRKYK